MIGWRSKNATLRHDFEVKHKIWGRIVKNPLPLPPYGPIFTKSRNGKGGSLHLPPETEAA